MKAIAAVLLLAGWTQVPPQALSRPLTRVEFGARLAGVEQAVAAIQSSQAAARVDAALPDHWTVAGDGATVTVPLEWLHLALTPLQRDAWSGTPAPGLQADLDRIGLVLRRLEADAGAPPPLLTDRRSDERGRLNAILARREFRGVGGPTLWDVMKQEAARELMRALQWILARLALNPTTGTWLVSGLFLAALCGCTWLLLGWWDRRRARQRGLQLEVGAALPRAGWQAWRQRAAAAQQAGDAAAVLRYSYLAAITCLAEAGRWRFEASRTPREHVRLFDRGNPGGQPLGDIVGALEAVEYGGRPASLEQAAEVLRHLDALTGVAGAAPAETGAA